MASSSVHTTERITNSIKVGLMDNPTYCRNACSKIQLYASHGIIPSIQLITTYETQDNPLTMDVVDKIVTHYFLWLNMFMPIAAWKFMIRPLLEGKRWGFRALGAGAFSIDPQHRKKSFPQKIFKKSMRPSIQQGTCSFIAYITSILTCPSLRQSLGYIIQPQVTQHSNHTTSSQLRSPKG